MKVLTKIYTHVIIKNAGELRKYIYQICVDTFQRQIVCFHLDIHKALNYDIHITCYYSPIRSSRCIVLSIYISNMHLIPFLMLSFYFHVAVVHACIINNDVDIVGDNNWGCKKGVTGVIYLQKPAPLLLKYCKG